ncbi:MAG TPA: DUF1223 domain-containing protein [Bryobacteraceae bacterium]|jgi:hypothetical protein|nr:DUF1223 domain-containing protein [Bryobacteraceae bacterium]
MKARISALLFSMGALVASGFQTHDPAPEKRVPVLLELFTSEGCSSCPPADQLLEALDKEQPFPQAELVVLSEHVDYWNGPGWHDPYSAHLFSERQIAYGEQFHIDEVYTPQIVVDGARQALGGNVAAIRSAVQAAAEMSKVPLTLTAPVRDGNHLKLHISSGPLPGTAGKTILYLAIAQERAESRVSGGENGGRLLTHVAVVRSLKPVEKIAAGASCSKDLTITVPQLTAPGLRVVAFLEDEKSRKVLGVAQARL